MNITFPALYAVCRIDFAGFDNVYRAVLKGVAGFIFGGFFFRGMNEERDAVEQSENRPERTGGTAERPPDKYSGCYHEDENTDLEPEPPAYHSEHAGIQTERVGRAEM